MLRLLAHPQRLRIVEILRRMETAPVHDITRMLAAPQAVTSQHLNLMRRVGLVKAERRGKEVWYGVADARCYSILDCIKKKASA